MDVATGHPTTTAPQACSSGNSQGVTVLDTNQPAVTATILAPRMRDRAIEGVIDFLAGWCGGVMNTVIGHPMDTIKVRIQTTQVTTSALMCASNTFRMEGVGGYFKGMAFPLVAVGSMNSILFGVYGNIERYLVKHRHSGDTTRRTYTDVFVAGSVAGAVQLVVACPTDLVKIKLQIQTSETGRAAAGRGGLYKGPIDCLRMLYKQNGVAGWYKGCLTMMCRDVPANGLYLTTFVYVGDKLGSGDKNSAAVTFFAGGMAGVISWLCILPLDVVKSRLQADSRTKPVYKGMLHCFRDSYKQEGWSVFFRGGGLLVLRAFPTNAGIFLAYTSVLQTLQQKVL